MTSITLITQGAADEIRTRDIQLGRLTLYQLSYHRLNKDEKARKQEGEKTLTSLTFSLLSYGWGWWDSNLLSGKAPDLQSGPALQLRGTPLVKSERVRDEIVRKLSLSYSSHTLTSDLEPLEGLEPPTS